MSETFYIGRRLSYDGALCTVRYYGLLESTKGEWLGVEWDDYSRGKHDGKHRNQQIFQCLAQSQTSASFIRPTRKQDDERSLLEAIKFKYVSDSQNANAVIISGKAAEEVGFDKIAREQSQLAELRIVVVNDLMVYGIAPRGSAPGIILAAQHELRETCPNIVELDLGWNLIEDWQSIAEICVALPNLRVLRTCGLRLHSFNIRANEDRNPFENVNELYLDECLLNFEQTMTILRDQSQFPQLKLVSLSKNGLAEVDLNLTGHDRYFSSVKTLLFEANAFPSLECLPAIISVFPRANEFLFQGNNISHLGFSKTNHKITQLEILDVSHNNIDSFEFVDALREVFPNLSSLRISKNGLNEQNVGNGLSNNTGSERLYYLTLARIPGLKTLNHTKITRRDREEGEIYYLSIIEKEIKELLLSASSKKSLLKKDVARDAENRFPLYGSLCLKYYRDSIIDQYVAESPAGKDLVKVTQTDDTVSQYPSGSLGARIVNATFYMKQHHTQQFSRSLPRTIPVNTIKALLVREFPIQLKPLQFRLIYESRELDPVDLTAESSTRSQTYGKSTERDKLSRKRWQEWGDWDADAVVETASRKEETRSHGDADDGDDETHKGEWTEDGFLTKEGRKWKMREVEIIGGMRSWGDWIEDGVRDAKIRIELSQI